MSENGPKMPTVNDPNIRKFLIWKFLFLHCLKSEKFENVTVVKNLSN